MSQKSKTLEELKSDFEKFLSEKKGITNEEFEKYLKDTIKLAGSYPNKFQTEFSRIQSRIWSIEYAMKEITESIRNGYFDEDDYDYYVKNNLDFYLSQMTENQYKMAFKILSKFVVESHNPNLYKRCLDILEHNDQKQVFEYLFKTKNTKCLLDCVQNQYHIFVYYKGNVEALQNLVKENKDKTELYRFLTYLHQDISKNDSVNIANELFGIIERDRDIKLCNDIIFNRIDKKYMMANQYITYVNKYFDKHKILDFYSKNATKKQIDSLFNEITSVRESLESEKENYKFHLVNEYC